MKRALIALAGLSLTACTTFEPPFQSASVHYNRVIADTNNELILLNIVRASHKEPMYFTGISQMHGSISLSGKTEISASLPQDAFEVERAFADATSIASGTASSKKETSTDAVRTLSPSLSATITTNPSFDYQVFDTQKFYNGILTSIPRSTLALYLRQGWREDLLTALTVEKVEFYLVGPDPQDSEAELIGSLLNEADNPDFQTFLDCFETQPASGSVAKAVLFNIKELQTPSASDLPDFTKSGYSISEDGDISFSVTAPETLKIAPVKTRANKTATDGSWDKAMRRTESCLNLISEHTEPAFTLEENQLRYNIDKNTFDVLLDADDFTSDSSKDETRATCVWKNENFKGRELSTARECPREPDKKASSRLAIGYTVRSTQSVMYFLGEYTRKGTGSDAKNTCFHTDENGTGKKPNWKGNRYCIDHKGTAEFVFELRENEPKNSDQVFAETRLHGETYWIASADSKTKNNTLTTISFLNQMINLQKSADQKPTTTTVRTIQ